MKVAGGFEEETMDSRDSESLGVQKKPRESNRKSESTAGILKIPFQSQEHNIRHFPLDLTSLYYRYTHLCSSTSIFQQLFDSLNFWSFYSILKKSLSCIAG